MIFCSEPPEVFNSGLLFVATEKKTDVIAGERVERPPIWVMRQGELRILNPPNPQEPYEKVVKNGTDIC